MPAAVAPLLLVLASCGSALLLYARTGESCGDWGRSLGTWLLLLVVLAMRSGARGERRLRWSRTQQDEGLCFVGVWACGVGVSVLGFGSLAWWSAKAGPLTYGRAQAHQRPSNHSHPAAPESPTKSLRMRHL